MQSEENLCHSHDPLNGVVNGGHERLVVPVGLSGCPSSTKSGVQRVLPVHCVGWVSLARQGQLGLGKVEDLGLGLFLKREATPVK